MPSFAEIVKSGVSLEEAVIQLPHIAMLVMGQSGVGKTHFLGTMPKPILVQQFDPPDKSATYENLGFLPGPLEEERGYEVQHYYSAKSGEPVIKVELFGEENPRDAKRFSNYMARMNNIEKDIRAWKVQTVALDSLTYFELAARWYNKYTFHPSNKHGQEVQDERIHYSASSRMVEEFFTGRYPGLQRLCNVAIIAHIKAETMDDEGPNENQRVVRKVLAAPGQQVTKIPAGLSEVYRLYVDEKDRHLLQTKERSDNNFQCKSIRGIPDGTAAHWKAIQEFLEQRYKNWLKELRA